MAHNNKVTNGTIVRDDDELAALAAASPDEPVKELLGSKSPKGKHGGDDHHTSRIKHKAIRPSARLAAAINGDASHLNGVDGVGAWQPRHATTGLRKFTKNSRRPRGRYGRGLPKKGGGGGKGTWGLPGSELVIDEENPLLEEDPHDPNYDSDSQDNCKFEAITPPLNEDEIEKFVTPIIAEYFEHGETEEVIYSLEELNLDENEYQVLVIAITLAMERKNSHREMISVLISDFYGRVFSEVDIERGFDLLLKSLPDLVLDTPGAPTILGNFIARAVADDCIPPAFVNKYLEGVIEGGDREGYIRSCVEHASALLNMKHGLVKLDSVWGITGGMRPVKYLIRQMKMLLKEYISSGELEEAVRCLQELEVPHFHHELVYEAVLMALEDGGEKTQELIASLLQSLSSSVIVTIDQLRNGFIRIYNELDDITLDIPLAYQNLERFVSKCVDFIPRDLVIKCPSRGRKRFVSEGDGGRVKDE